MKDNIVIFWILTAYFALLGTVYLVWNIINNGTPEWAGTVALYFSGGLSGLIAFYLGLVKRKQGGELHEDLLEADIDDGEPELGEFSPWSWWPILLALASALILMGFAFNGNFFVIFFSIPLLAVATVGWVYEYYRGFHAR